MTDETTTRPFRFGVVAPVLGEASIWRDQVRRIADDGYATLLMPDVQQWQPAPGPTLAVAATLAPKLRVGTWVYASPLRTARLVAWESHSLSEVTDGRFEMGIGAGRPGIEDELRELGLPPLAPGEKVTRMREAVTILRELDGPDRHTPVVMAVRGPKTRAVALECADTITFAPTPADTRADVSALAREARTARDVELALHISVVGDSVAPFMSGPDTDPAALHASGSLAALPGDPAAAVDELLRRREEDGFSYVVVGANALDVFAPVVTALAGH